VTTELQLVIIIIIIMLIYTSNILINWAVTVIIVQIILPSLKQAKERYLLLEGVSNIYFL